MNTLLISVTFQFSVSVATSGKPALKSNSNDCAPGETENLVCIMECCNKGERNVCRPERLFILGNDGFKLTFTLFSNLNGEAFNTAMHFQCNRIEKWMLLFEIRAFHRKWKWIKSSFSSLKSVRGLNMETFHCIRLIAIWYRKGV